MRRVYPVQDEWLDVDANLEKWESCTLTASDRRVLMTTWLGKAWDRFCADHRTVRARPKSTHRAWRAAR